MSEPVIKIQLPDGSIREVPRGTTPHDVAMSISPRLAAAVVVARIRPLTTSAATTDTDEAASEATMYGAAQTGERLVDLTAPLTEDVALELLKENDEAALRVVRHSAAHVMATAILELFPETKLGHGPATDAGFFYDVYRETPFSDADLAAIEARMAEVVARDEKFVREEEPREKGLADYDKQGEFMKVHFIEKFTHPGETISLYKNGNFTDFCRGPHVPSTARVKAFKVTSVAGAYWLGDEKNQQLQRIYGTAFFNAKDLDAHFKRLEEIKARDHRVLGKQLDLYSIQEVAGSGLIFWHPRGGIIRKAMEDWMRDECIRRGYEMVYTPHIMRREMWKISGHEENYGENMYPAMELDDAEYRLKPMNCPGHILIYKNSPKSYRDLPIRYAELGNVYRYERSGTMHGLLRVRGFTQDDAHIFCTPEQIEDEIAGCIDFAESVLHTFGFQEFKVELSTWDPNDSKFIGSAEKWEGAVSSLTKVLERKGIPYKTIPGEAAFYGPKIDIKLVDILGRMWQLSTVQFDWNLPQRFDLVYKGEDGELHQPVMVHRALFGSVERFFGVLIEHYAGAFPLWLAPVQVGLVPISEKHLEYAEQVKAKLEAAGLRVELDSRNEKMNAKIREFTLQKVPFVLIMGDKEATTEAVSVRTRGKGDEGSIQLKQFIRRAQRLITNYAIELDQDNGRRFGPIAQKYLSKNKWSGIDQYPSSETWSGELEDILNFAVEEGVISKFLPRLLAKENQRDEALSELRTALFFRQHGFRIFDWDPQGQGDKTGEFRIQRANEPPIFVEVKSPGWEAQILDIETRKLRSRQPKFLPNTSEGGAIGTWEQLRSCIKNNAYGKFASNEANLLVIADDFKPPLDSWMVNIALYDSDSGYGNEAGYFTSNQFERLGGVVVFQPEVEVSWAFRSYPLRYRYEFHPNRNALIKLPLSFENLDR